MPSALRAPLALVLLASVALFVPARAALAQRQQHQADRPFPAAKRSQINATLNNAFAESKAPGAVVGIWIPGEGSFVAARGFADLRSRQPMRSSYYFRIGSITKTYTVTALLILADEKKLGLDDPVSKYVDFVPNGDKITLRMLANMTAGLHSYTEDDAAVKAIIGNPNRVWTPRELVDAGLRNPPDFPPGTGWHYSNTNTVLLGMILEKVSGQPIGTLFEQKLFAPLRLKQTVWPMSAQMPSPHASGYTEQTPDGSRANATNRNPSWAFTAGALISTLPDLRTWVTSYTTGSLVSPEMQKERLTWVTFPPNTPTRRYGLGIGEDNGWLGHTGELPGYNVAAYYLPAKKAVIVVMVNSDIPVGKANPAPAIFKALAALLTPENVPE
ncbi:MAG: serine hydrolase domain-containing protein [Burkholderiales bacterium]